MTLNNNKISGFVGLIYKKVNLVIVLAFAISLTFYYVSAKFLPKEIYNYSVRIIPPNVEDVEELINFVDKIYINKELFVIPTSKFSEFHINSEIRLQLMKQIDDSLTNEVFFSRYLSSDKSNFTRAQTENIFKKIKIEYKEDNKGKDVILINVSSTQNNVKEVIDDYLLFSQKQIFDNMVKSVRTQTLLYIKQLKLLKEFSEIQNYISSINSEIKRLNLILKENISGNAFITSTMKYSTTSIQDSIFLRILASLVVGFILSLIFVLLANLKNLTQENG